MSFIIKTATLDDIKTMFLWANLEGWNIGINDYLTFPVIDVNGFFIGLLKNEPIASLAAVRYSNQFGFIGLYIVKEGYRQNGYGIQIWQHGTKYLNNVNIIGLDGVLAQQNNYKKFDFELAHRNVRYAGVSPLLKPSTTMKPINSTELEKIIFFEKNLFPVNRSVFLKSWIHYATKAIAYIENNHVRGYGVIRECNDGYKIGPLFADNLMIANEIFLDLTYKLNNNEKIFLDVPEPNHAAVLLAENYNMEAIFETARMYKGINPQLDLTKIYGTTTFEVG